MLSKEFCLGITDLTWMITVCNSAILDWIVYPIDPFMVIEG